MSTTTLSTRSVFAVLLLLAACPLGAVALQTAAPGDTENQRTSAQPTGLFAPEVRFTSSLVAEPSNESRVGSKSSVGYDIGAAGYGVQAGATPQGAGGTPQGAGAGAGAVGAPASPAPPAPPAPAPPAPGSNPLDKLGFGVALGFRWNVLKPDLVNDATVDANGIVRVNTRSNTAAGMWLETHYFFTRSKNGVQSNFGHGPFVGVQAGSDQIIQAVGLGYMVGWKVGDPPPAGSDKRRMGFGLGFGYAAVPSAKTLGDEFVANQPAPKGPDGKPLPVRFETRDKGSVMVILSVTF